MKVSNVFLRTLKIFNLFFSIFLGILLTNLFTQIMGITKHTGNYGKDFGNAIILALSWIPLTAIFAAICFWLINLLLKKYLKTESSNPVVNEITSQNFPQNKTNTSMKSTKSIVIPFSLGLFLSLVSLSIITFYVLNNSGVQSALPSSSILIQLSPFIYIAVSTLVFTFIIYTLMRKR